MAKDRRTENCDVCGAPLGGVTHTNSSEVLCHECERMARRAEEDRRKEARHKRFYPGVWHERGIQLFVTY